MVTRPRGLFPALLLLPALAAAQPLVPITVADGRATTVTIDGAVYRQAEPGHHLYYDAPEALIPDPLRVQNAEWRSGYCPAMLMA
jgi:hypothetical protein